MNFILRERFIEGCRRATPEEQTAFIKILGELRAALHDPSGGPESASESLAEPISARR